MLPNTELKLVAPTLVATKYLQPVDVRSACYVANRTLGLKYVTEKI